MKEMDQEFVYIKCVPVSATRCHAVISQKMLLSIVKNPQVLAGKISPGEPDVQAIKELYCQIQRDWQSKKNNVASYADYQLDILPTGNGHRRKLGATPTIYLWRNEPLEYVTADGVDWQPGTQCQFGLSKEDFLIAVDGDTQVAARFVNKHRSPETDKQAVEVTIFHGISADEAAQIFHDFNKLGRPVTDSIALQRDSQDPFNKEVKDFIAQTPLLHGRVEMVKRNIGSRNQDKIVTLKTLNIAAEAFFGTSKKAIAQFDLLAPLFHDWLGRIFDIFQDEFLDVTSVIRFQPTIRALAATGAKAITWVEVGGKVLPHTDGFHEVIHSLRRVDWSRGKHWENIALLPDGTQASSRNAWTGTFKALSDPECTAYVQVRHGLSKAVSA